MGVSEVTHEIKIPISFFIYVEKAKEHLNKPSGNAQHVSCFQQDELPSQKMCGHQLQ